jgi:DNA-directed RNA polymerase subunit M
MFCPECKSLMISSAGQLKCRKCGYIRKICEDDQMSKTTRRSEKEIVIVEDEGTIRTLPSIAIKCPKCEHNEAFWWLRQLRAADESEVRFFRCTKCGHTWRQYD